MGIDDSGETLHALEREIERMGAERREMFARLAELESERATHALELFTMAAHELRTPLQSLMLSTDLMLERMRGSADEVAREWLIKHLERQDQVVRRLQELMESWLIAPQLRAGTLPATYDELDLAMVVGQVVDRYREELAWARCPLELDLHPMPGRWDRFRVDAVLTNVLSNAMKYGAGHPVHVALFADDLYATISVRDHGIGIAPEDQDRIFQRFERVDTPTRVPGFGIGLWMSRVLLRTIGGSIHVDSAPALGATFTVKLPRAFDED